MKQYSNEEITSKCQSIWDEEYLRHGEWSIWKESGKITINRNTPEKVIITIACTHESPPLNLNVMQRLSNFFETTNINDDDHFRIGGCETCDYGSRIGFTLTIRPDETQK